MHIDTNKEEAKGETERDAPECTGMKIGTRNLVAFV